MLAFPLPAIAQNAAAPYERDVVITAYYSPLPDQCCYVKGSFEADKILNGNGTHGADGTPVYEGMIAAPKSYAFGTRLSIPGLGTVTVHDRGGAIVETENYDRIDLWAGSGEEGLARALAFGVRRAKATVYPPGTSQPGENFGIAGLAAPLGVLQAYKAKEPTLVDVHPVPEERSTSVRLLQERLQKTGYLGVAPTGYFGPVTKDALTAFVKDMNLSMSDGTVTEEIGAHLEAALQRLGAKKPVVEEIDIAAGASAIAEAKRTLQVDGQACCDAIWLAKILGE